LFKKKPIISGNVNFIAFEFYPNKKPGLSLIPGFSLQNMILEFPNWRTKFATPFCKHNYL